MKVKYVADDGTEFWNEDQCRAYETLIKAASNSAFKQVVKELFDGCTTWYRGSDPNDPDVKVFRVEEDMQKFTANLVRALPALQGELTRALNKGV
ncbi:hypothetical protein [Burkholderia phage BCSR5]|nr:hypothetical protein [Burkholderia phage BCSR5]